MKLFIFVDENSREPLLASSTVFAVHPTKHHLTSSETGELYHKAADLVRAGTHDLMNALPTVLKDEGFQVLEVGEVIHYSAILLGAGEDATLPL